MGLVLALSGFCPGKVLQHRMCLNMNNRRRVVVMMSVLYDLNTNSWLCIDLEESLKQNIGLSPTITVGLLSRPLPSLARFL